MKNKIIYDLKVKGDWLNAEVVASKRENGNGGREGSVGVSGTGSDESAVGAVVEGDFSENVKEFLDKNGEMEDVKVKLFQTLLHFKKELGKAQQAVDQGQIHLRETDQKRANLSSEVSHLQSLLHNSAPGTRTSTTSIDIALSHQRTQDLEHQLKSAQSDMATLQSKVALWSRASKRNQEARIAAEACQKHAESEVSRVKSELRDCLAREEDLKRRFSEVEGRVREFEAIQGQMGSIEENARNVVELKNRLREVEQDLVNRDANLRAHELALESARKRVKEFEETIREASGIMEELEKENRVLRDDVRAKESRCTEYEKRIGVLQSEFKELVKVQSLNAEELDTLRSQTSTMVAREEYDVIRREREEVGRQLDEGKRDWERQRLEGEVRRLEGIVVVLEEARERLGREVEDARKSPVGGEMEGSRDVVVSEDPAEDQTARIQSLETELATTKQSLLKAHQELDRLISETSSSTPQQQTQPPASSTSEQDLKTLQKTYESQIHTLTLSRLEAITTAEEVTQQFEEVVMELATLKSRLADSELQTPRAVSEDSDRLHLLLNQKDERLSSLESQTAALQSELQAREEVVKELKEQVSANQEMINALVERLESKEEERMRRDVSSPPPESAGTEYNATLELDLAEARAMIATLTVRLDDAKGELDEKRRRVAELERDGMDAGGTLDRGRGRARALSSAGLDEYPPVPAEVQQQSRIPTLNRDKSTTRSTTLERGRDKSTTRGNGTLEPPGRDRTLERGQARQQQDYLAVQTRVSELEVVNANLLEQVRKLTDRLALKGDSISTPTTPPDGEKKDAEEGEREEEVDWLRKEVREMRERCEGLEREVEGERAGKREKEVEVEELKGVVESMREKVRKIVKKPVV
ncbi:hypothetical protein HK097_000452 [Rhizophlyctis rosea]|uniref:Uncharacterized protein n=1 Tax=Rhizophlyctis rosea TaxID=64517 RepID=A0AAD5X2J9_9FUNG|nr:hypothetical protein HK097_000452 [Rhizophlyctis rosea]